MILYRVVKWVRADDPRWLQAGVTARMLDHWTRAELLVADDPAPGSGNHRSWPESEIAVAGRIVRLRRIGLALETAADVARLGWGEHTVAPGITIVVSAL
jgi:hypothetical protein